MSKKKIIAIVLSLIFISSVAGFVVYFYKNEKKVLKYLEQKIGNDDENPKSKKINSNVHYNESKLQKLYIKKDGTFYFKIRDRIKGKEYNDFNRVCYVEDYDEYIYFNSPNDKMIRILKDNRFFQTGDIYNANFIYKYLYGSEFYNFLRKINFRQKYCRFPNTGYLTNKKSLYSHFMKMKEKYPEDYNFMIESYILPDQIDKFEKVYNNNKDNNKRNLWIVKPQNLSRGRNIKVVSDLKDIIEEKEFQEEIVREANKDEKNITKVNVKNNKNNNNIKNKNIKNNKNDKKKNVKDNKKDKNVKNNKNNKNNKNKDNKKVEENIIDNKKEYIKKIKKVSKHGDVIVSKYIEPSLIKNKKYDIRIMCLVTSYDPLMIYLYDNGVVRFATENYSEDKNKLSNNYIHLTNVSINEKNKNYIRNSDFDNLKESSSSLSSFKKHCEENNINYELIMSKIKDYVIKAILSNYDSSVKELQSYNLPSCKNLFELFGVDIILDKDYNPYLIEFNLRPGMATATEVSKKIYDNVICDTLNIIGIRKYNRKSMKKNNRICSLEENLKECYKELERYTGHFELIFPLKDNISKYSKFINNKTKLNTELWKHISTTNN